jgi:hypothetical protein
VESDVGAGERCGELVCVEGIRSGMQRTVWGGFV